MEITGVDVNNNILDLNGDFKTLLEDKTIPEKITNGRRSYLRQSSEKEAKKQLTNNKPTNVMLIIRSHFSEQGRNGFTREVVFTT